MQGVRKDAHIGANLSDNSGSRSHIDSRYRTEQIQRLAVFQYLVSDCVFYRFPMSLKRFQMAKSHRKKASLMSRETSVQGNQNLVDPFPRLRFQAFIQCGSVDTAILNQMPDNIAARRAKGI